MKSQLLGRLIATMTAAGILGVAGCATQYAYRPAEMVDATNQGLLAARYPVPPESPRGVVYVTSFGITQVDVRPGQRAALLQVRLAVSNDNDSGPWTVDSRQQVLNLDGQSPLHPAYVNT